eukprot:1908813-Pleurochrysis_carterae.AAC.2
MACVHGAPARPRRSQHTANSYSSIDPIPCSCPNLHDRLTNPHLNPTVNPNLNPNPPCISVSNHSYSRVSVRRTLQRNQNSPALSASLRAS